MPYYKKKTPTAWGASRTTWTARPSPRQPSVSYRTQNTSRYPARPAQHPTDRLTFTTSMAYMTRMQELGAINRTALTRSAPHSIETTKSTTSQSVVPSQTLQEQILTLSKSLQSLSLQVEASSSHSPTQTLSPRPPTQLSGRSQTLSEPTSV